MHMDRAIFDLHLSMEATSAYIVICSLLDEGLFPILSLVRARWNGNEQSLRNALHDLMQHNVVNTDPTVFDGEPLVIRSREKWRRGSTM
jgi:hypothetical protein